MTSPASYSFEFFPPQSEVQERRFWNAFERLSALEPAFVSLTYGAGGTDRARSERLLKEILARGGPAPAAHLTMVGASRQDLDAQAARWWKLGIRRLVALRGDMPNLERSFRPHPQGYRDSTSFVAGLRRIANFEIAVSAYPESHPASVSPAADLDCLKSKIDAGASKAITQYFFEAETFLRFRDRARRAGITAPLIPGILPITNFEKTRDFSQRCGANVPDWLGKRFEGLDQEPETRTLVAAATASELCQQLRAEGVEAFHFYTLNQAPLSIAICRLLDLQPGLSAAA